MTTRRLPFHLAEQVAVILPALMKPDGTPLDLTTVTTVDMITQRDDHTTTETTRLGTTPPPGLTAGVLNLYNAPGGVLQLTVDDGYFTAGVITYAVFFVDGQDYPEEGYLILAPQGIKP